MKARLAPLNATIALLAAGCMAGLSPLQQNKVYADRTVEWLEGMSKHLEATLRTASAEEKEWLIAEVNPVFNNLKRAARLYIIGLQVWEATGREPEGLDEQKKMIIDTVHLMFELIATGGK